MSSELRNGNASYFKSSLGRLDNRLFITCFLGREIAGILEVSANVPVQGERTVTKAETNGNASGRTTDAKL